MVESIFDNGKNTDKKRIISNSEYEIATRGLKSGEI